MIFVIEYGTVSSTSFIIIWVGPGRRGGRSLVPARRVHRMAAYCKEPYYFALESRVCRLSDISTRILSPTRRLPGPARHARGAAASGNLAKGAWAAARGDHPRRAAHPRCFVRPFHRRKFSRRLSALAAGESSAIWMLLCEGGEDEWRHFAGDEYAKDVHDDLDCRRRMRGIHLDGLQHER